MLNEGLKDFWQKSRGQLNISKKSSKSKIFFVFNLVEILYESEKMIGLYKILFEKEPLMKQPHKNPNFKPLIITNVIFLVFFVIVVVSGL